MEALERAPNTVEVPVGVLSKPGSEGEGLSASDGDYRGEGLSPNVCAVTDSEGIVTVVDPAGIEHAKG